MEDNPFQFHINTSRHIKGLVGNRKTGSSSHVRRVHNILKEQKKEFQFDPVTVLSSSNTYDDPSNFDDGSVTKAL